MANMSETNFDALIVAASHTQAVKVRCNVDIFLDVNGSFFPCVVHDRYVLWARWKIPENLHSDYSTSVVVSLAVLVSIPRHPLHLTCAEPIRGLRLQPDARPRGR
jgi:hypothetical protein